MDFGPSRMADESEVANETPTRFDVALLNALQRGIYVLEVCVITIIHCNCRHSKLLIILQKCSVIPSINVKYCISYLLC